MQSVQSTTVLLSGLDLGVVCHCRDTEAASYDFQLCDFVSFCSKSSSFKVLRCPSAGGRHSVYTLLTPKTNERKGGKERWRRTQLGRPMNVVASTFVLVSFPPLLLYPIPSASPLIHPRNHGKALSFSMCVPPRSVFVMSRERGAREGYSLSMSLYFFRNMDTWSLNRTGSSLI